jgi:D-amino-acid dehydrogenase
MTDTIVVGGGIVGSSVAYHLARAGVETLLIDREDEGRATDAGAGVVSPATSSQTASDTWFSLAVAAFDYYDELDDRLGAEQDAPTGYDRRGLLAVAVDDDELEAFEALARRTEDRRRSSGYLAPGTVEEVSAEAARELFPALAEPRRALHFEQAARVDGGRFATALRRAGEHHGLDVETASVDALSLTDGVVEGVTKADGRRLDAANVVITGGAWSPSFGDQLGVSVPVEPVRGQVVHASPSVDVDAWPMVVSLRDRVLAPWPENRLAVGATREPHQGFEPHPTVSGVRDVLSEIERVAPGLADATFAGVRVGLRPVSADGLPVLGTVPDVTGAYLATGHGATGLTHGPFTGRLVADLVAGREPAVDLGPFSVARFG